MTRKLAFTTAFPLLVILAGLAPAARGEGPSWMEIKSPHFSVITDAGEKRGREVAMRFEQMRAVFAALMVKGNVNVPVPLEIVAFRNTKEMRQFAPLWHGKPTQVAGLFLAGGDRSFIMLDMSAESPWQVVFHEYAHQLMNAILSREMDPWFEEGFAEYFSTIEVDNKEAHVGKPQEYAYFVLQRNGMMKIADLFKVQQNTSTYNESGDHRTVFYAESGMLVHYLYDHKLIPKAGSYFDLRTQGMPVEQAIQQAFGMSPAQFDKIFNDYVHTARYSFYTIPTPEGINAKDYSAVSVSAEDGSAVLADIHLHSPQYQDKAISEFEEILKADPNNAAAVRGLGYAYLQKRDFQKSGEYFHRAVQLNSKDAKVHYYSALLLTRENGVPSRADLPQLIQELQTAISLDPNFADSYMLLAFALASSGKPAEGVQNAQKAVALSPRNEAYQFNLAQMCVSNRQLDDAERLLHELETARNPELASRAQHMLQVVAQMRGLTSHPTREDGSPRLVRPVTKADESPDDENTAEEKPVDETPAIVPPANVSKAPTNPHPTKYMTGTLTSVDCASPPAAVLTVVAGGKTWKLTVSDVNHAILFGADQFSCSWTKKSIGLNYRQTGDAEGTVVSLQIR